jgi:hypothetical protein
MEPNIADISSEKVRNEIRKLQDLESRISWVRTLTLLGAMGGSLWLIYRVFATHGFLSALVAFVGLSFVYKFGASPMFAVAASALCFYFKAVGTWLPITSYVLAAILLYVDLRRDNLRRACRPIQLGFDSELACTGRRE